LADIAKLSQILQELGEAIYAFEGTSEIRISHRVSNIPSKTLTVSIDLDDYLAALDAFDNYWPTFSAILERIQHFILETLCYPCNLSVKKVQGTSVFIANSSKELFSLRNILSQISQFAVFISKSMFTEENQPCDLFLEKWSQLICQALFHLSKNASFSSPENQELVKALELELIQIDMLAPSHFPLLKLEEFQDQICRTQREEILFNVKCVLDSSDRNTSEINDGLARGGLSTLLGKNYTQGDFSKSGQEGIDREFCLSEFHVSNRTQTLMDYVYGTLDQFKATSKHPNYDLLITARNIIDLQRIYLTVTGIWYYLSRFTRDCIIQ
jgi:hypothetical protein